MSRILRGKELGDWIERLVAAGYRCEHRDTDGCLYRPAPHFLPGGYACDACEVAHREDTWPDSKPRPVSKPYNFPETFAELQERMKGFAPEPAFDIALDVSDPFEDDE